MTLLGTPLAVRLSSGRTDVHVSGQVKSLRYRSVVPGGFASCEVQLVRPLSLDPDEVQAYGDVIIYDGRSGETVWQGRLEDPGRASGPQGEVWTLRAVGPSAHARDRYLPLVYIDSNWREWHPSTISDVAGVDREQLDQGGSGNPALHLQLPKGLDIGSTSFYGRDTALLAETGQHLARFAFTWDAGISSANYRISILIGPAGGSIAEVSSINFNTGGGTNADVIDTDFADPSDTVRVTINPAGGVDPTTDTVWCSIMAMRLMATLYDVDGNEIVDPAEYTTNYYTADQIVADLLGRLLDKYDGAGASIAACTHQVNQLSYPDGTTAEQVLNDLMTLESGYYWKAGKESATNPGTYEFTWKAWPTTIRYESHSRDGLDSPGSLQELYNAVTVRWRDPIGRIRRTRRTQTVDALTDAGLTREALIDLGDEVGSVENAEQAGDEFLAAHLYAPNAGRLTVRHPIVDFERGRMVQPWEVEPGGLLRITDIKPRFDALSPTARDGVSVFRVTAVDYDAGSNTATLELDSPPRTIENLIGRMATAPDKRRR